MPASAGGGQQAPVTIQISAALFCIVAYDTAGQFYAIVIYYFSSCFLLLLLEKLPSCVTFISVGLITTKK